MRSAHYLHASYSLRACSRTDVSAGWLTLVKILKSGRIYHVLTLYAVNRILCPFYRRKFLAITVIFIRQEATLEGYLPMRLPYLQGTNNIDNRYNRPLFHEKNNSFSIFIIIL